MATTSSGRLPRNSLTLDQIVAAAREELQSVSLERLSMRAVAARLGAAPMALYNHVASKEALVDELLDRTLGEVDTATAPDATWSEGMVELGTRLFQHLVENPWAVPALMARPDPGENATRLGEAFLGLALHGGLDTRAATLAFTGTLALVYGAAGFLSPKPEQQASEAVTERIRGAAPEHAATTTVAEDLVRWDDPANVPALLHVLLAGFGARTL